MYFSSKIVDLTNHNKESSSVSAFQLFFLSKQSWAFTTGIYCWHPKLEQNTSHTMMCTILKESLFFLIVVHESLVCPEQLNCLLFFRKSLQVPQILWFSSIVVYFNPFQLWLYDFEIHLFTPRTTEGLICICYRRFKHSLMLQKEKTCIKSQGVKTFEQKELKMCIFFLFCLNIIFFHLVLPFRSYRR